MRTTLSGVFILLNLALDPASSITSIALSGRYLSDIYLSLSSTQAFTASLDIFTL